MLRPCSLTRRSAWIVAALVAFAPFARCDDGPDTAMFAAFQNRAWSDAAKLARERIAAEPDEAKEGNAWFVLGHSLQNLEDLDGALAAFAKLAEDRGYGGHARMLSAGVHVKKGDLDAAFRMLAEAAAAGFSSAQELGIEPVFDSIRGDPRYADVLTKIQENGRAAQERGERLTFSTETDRKSARLILYGALDSLRVVIDHGIVPWRDGYAKELESAEFDGRRWRLGANDWTTLDTNVGLSLGDIDVPAGEYGLTIRREKGGKPMLELHDMALMRKQRIDPYYCQALPIPSLVLELDLEDLDEPARNLAISMAPIKPGDGHACELRIDFGPHRLTAPLVLQER
jgi:hypothetical protein